MKSTFKALLAALVFLLTFVPASIRAQAEDETNKAVPPVKTGGNPAKETMEEQSWINAGARMTANNHGSPEKNKTAIAIVSIVAVFGMPIAIVAILLYFRHRQSRMMHETIRNMVEKSVPIPPELLAGGSAAWASRASPSARRNDLRSGLVLVAVGAGVMMLAGKYGLIPLFIGLALIITWIIGRISAGSKTPQ
jgi:hypothetical protein